MNARNIAIAVSGTLAGRQLELEIIPFRFASLYFVGYSKDGFPHTRGFHLFFGPFHLWSMRGLQDLFGIGLQVGLNPFHGQSAYMPKPQP